MPSSARHAPAVLLLLARGARAWVDEPDANQNTPLHLAAYGSALDAARVLLTSGAKVDAQNKFGATPLHWAASPSPWRADPRAVERVSPELIRLLLARGARIDARDHQGEREGSAHLVLPACGRHDSMPNSGAWVARRSPRGDDRET